MNTDMFLSWQFGMTLIAVLAIAVFMLMRVRRSQQRRGEEPGEVKATPHTTTGTGPGSGTPRH